MLQFAKNKAALLASAFNSRKQGTALSEPADAIRRRWLRPALVLLAATAVLVGLAGAFTFVGFEIHRHQATPVYSLFDRVDRKLETTFFANSARLQSEKRTTALLNLNIDVTRVDTGRSGAGGPLGEMGGGLTSFGKDVLLLPYNGRVYASQGPDQVRPTHIFAPDNNRNAYTELAASEELKGEYEFEPTYLRYNDIKYFESEIGRGLVVSYTEFHPEQRCYTNTLAVLDIEASARSIDEVVASPSDWRTLFRAAPCLPFKKMALAIEGQMAGGRMAFQAPSTIFLTSGDYHFDGMRSDGPPIAQDPNAQYGKILKVDIATGQGEVISTGHRNAQGIALLSDGRLMEVEHGPQGGDELNLIEPGANYGWPLESYGVTYRGIALPSSKSFGRHDTFQKPLFAWTPSITVSSLAQIEGFNEAWDGDLLIGTLTDMSLHRVRLEGDRVTYAERIPIGSRIRYVHQHSDGRIVLWTDREELVFISGEPRVDEGVRLADYLDGAKLSAGEKKSVHAAIDRCSECHSFLADRANGRSPGLGRMFEADIASSDYPAYSPGLKSKPGRWTPENLAAFLNDSNAFAPGTSMPNPQIRDAKVVEGIVGYLAALRNDH